MMERVQAWWAGVANRPVVVLRLRGTATIGATVSSILSSYADELSARGGRLYLSGVDPGLIRQFETSGRINDSTGIRLVEATPTIGESTHAAVEEATVFLLSAPADPLPPDDADPWGKRVVDGITGLLVHDETDTEEQSGR
jgi:SulP family sulfate permease